MADRQFIADYLETYYEDMEPKEFYREIFPAGELQKAGGKNYGDGKYNAIAVEIIKKADGGYRAKRYTITDDLDKIDELVKSDNFIIVSPISYRGKSREAINARYIYALAIDLDGITKPQYLYDLIHQMKEVDYLPEPTYIIWSGSGLHLYYQFKEPIPCYKSLVPKLSKLKHALTEKIWNGYTTELYEKTQFESLFQGFRLVGGITKAGGRTRAFRTGEKVSIEYLNGFVPEQDQVKDIKYKSTLPLEQAKIKYPEWYEKRYGENPQPKGTWQCKRDLYDWWLRRLNEATVGHRYYCIMCLAIYARKSGISKEELEKDAFDLVDVMDSLTTSEDNHFTHEDVLSALEAYNDNYITFPRDIISSLSNIEIKANKRNGRKQELHLEIARSTKAILKKSGELKNDGRPSKEKEVIEWRQSNPKGEVNDCARDLGITRRTVLKHWRKCDE